MNSQEPNSAGSDASQGRLGKVALLREIEDGLSQLNAYLDSLTTEQLSEIRDSEGWTVKDHLTHMAAWERAAVVFLQGKPRNEGLRIEKEHYLSLMGNVDEINAIIQQQWQGLSIQEVRSEFAQIHAEMVRLVEMLSDDDLLRAMGTFAPSTSGKYDDRPIYDLIYGDTVEHYREHLEWIENLVSKGA